MKKTILTGFTPFDGRSHNASWIAASALAAAHPGVSMQAILIPVCWGAPRQVLAPLVKQFEPECIVAMGEGEPGVFRLETIARNVRRERPDNNGRYPMGECIDGDGPQLRVASADCSRLQSALAAQGIPVRLSDDAGGFLCEELLYILEELRETHEFLRTVLFVHLPPHGTELLYCGQTRTCDEALLRDFGQQLLLSMNIPDHLAGMNDSS